jgi:hypothetical protein
MADLTTYVDEIEKVEKNGDLLKIRLKEPIRLDLSGIDSIVLEKEFTIRPDGRHLFALVSFDLLNAGLLTEKEKKQIKEKILKGGIDVLHPNENVKAFKKIFKPGDFDNELGDIIYIIKDELETTRQIFPGGDLWHKKLKGALEIADYLNIKEEFEEDVYDTLKEELIEELKGSVWYGYYSSTEKVLDFISDILKHYPEFKERIMKDKGKTIKSIAERLKRRNKIEYLKKLVSMFRLKEYLVEVL